MKDYEITQLQKDIGVARGTNIPETFSDALTEALTEDNVTYQGMSFVNGKHVFIVEYIDRRTVTLNQRGYFELDSNLALQLDEGCPISSPKPPV